MSYTKTLIIIIGPTAIGKTALAIEVAKHFSTEILSSDSRQFYKEMNIGTAVPSPDELAAVPHHFIQHLSIQQAYSVGDFERDAIHFISEFFKQKNELVMVGGSGLYEKAVTEGLDHFPEVPNGIREALAQELETFGIEKLQEELQQKDAEYFEKADIQNPHRVIRALEIIRGTGKKFSSFQQNESKQRDFHVIKIGIKTDREIIYNRINQRVDIMVKNGLIEEAKSLYKFKDLNALQTVGYRELFQCFAGEITQEFAIEEIKKNTRRFAKRQLTWYRKDKDVHWFQPNATKEVITFVESQTQA